MRLKSTVVLIISILLNACGSGGLNIPDAAIEGAIIGKILGGLYSGGTITAYTLDEKETRQFISDSPVSENGDFELLVVSQPRYILLEVSGGSYVDPASKKAISIEPDFVLSTIVSFQSSEEQNVIITPYTHLASALVLYNKKTNPPESEKDAIANAFEEINSLYSINLYSNNLKITLQEEQSSLNIEGDEKQGLLINALSQLANDEAANKDEALQELYSLSSLTAIMYEDLHTDGLLDGKSILNEDNQPKQNQLAFGDQEINLDFYRINLAFAVKKALNYSSFNQFVDPTEQKSYVFFIARSQSLLYGEVTNDGLGKLIPEISIKANQATKASGEFTLEFNVENTLYIDSVQVKLNEQPIKHFATPPGSEFTVPINTTPLKEGNHIIFIEAVDSFEHTVTLQLPITIDNSPPSIELVSSTLTSQSEFLLEGTFSDEFSIVKRITVDGQEADLLDDRWSIMVTLDKGVNEFDINIEDELGNNRQIISLVTFDSLVPDITISSPLLTNNSDYLFKGSITDSQYEIELFTVNDNSIVLVDNQWSISIVLQDGDNEIIIGIKEESGHYIRYVEHVLLDTQAPDIAITSAPLTNQNQFVLEGIYIDSHSPLKTLTINGQEITSQENGIWSQSVTLIRGVNKFVIGAEDIAGNYQEFTTQVELDDIQPNLFVTSEAITNQAPYLLSGEYAENNVDEVKIRINGEAAELLSGNKWQLQVILSEGSNDFVIEIEDGAGNSSAITKTVTLVGVAPGITIAENVEALFSNNDGTYFKDLIKQNNVTPLYIETSHLSLSGLAVNKENLNNAKIPYFVFNVEEQTASGEKIILEDLTVEYRYLVNDAEIVTWQAKALETGSNELLLPLVSETLSNNWYKVNQDDLQVIQVRVKDKAGNISTEQVTFKVQFYTPDVEVAINAELTSIANGTFASRSEYLENESVAVNYNLHNSNDRPIRIRLSDQANHSIVREYDELLRENKVQSRSIESWRRSTISGLDEACPTLNNDWQRVTTLWNRNNGDWIQISRQIVDHGIFDVYSDTAVPPVATEWVNYKTDDQEMFPINKSLNDGTYSYNIDYLFNYNPDSQSIDYSQPGLVKGWSYTANNGADSVTCPDVHAIQSRIDYAYLPVDGYPKNTITTKSENGTFSTNRFTVLDQDQTEIQSINGWFIVPAGHTAIIRKHILPDNVSTYADIRLENPDSIKDYDPHRYDKSISWTISQSIVIDMQFNPDGILDDNANIKQMQFSADEVIINFIR